MPNDLLRFVDCNDRRLECDEVVREILVKFRKIEEG